MSENDTDVYWELPQLDVSEFDEVLHEDDDVIPVAGEIDIAGADVTDEEFEDGLLGPEELRSGDCRTQADVDREIQE